MCYMTAYWAGIKKIVCACRKEKVNRKHYEGRISTQMIQKKMNNKITLHFEKGLEEKSALLVQKWEVFLGSHSK